MCDVLKIFITTEHADLCHYELKNLTEDSILTRRRDGKQRVRNNQQQASWWVEDETFVTRYTGASERLNTIITGTNDDVEVAYVHSQ